MVDNIKTYALANGACFSEEIRLGARMADAVTSVVPRCILAERRFVCETVRIQARESLHRDRGARFLSEDADKMDECMGPATASWYRDLLDAIELL